MHYSLGRHITGVGLRDSLSYSGDKLHSSEHYPFVKGNLERAFLISRKKKCQKLSISTGRRREEQTSQKPGMRPTDRQLSGPLQDLCTWLYEGQTLFVATPETERDSFHVFNIHGRFPMKMQKKQ